MKNIEELNREISLLEEEKNKIKIAEGLILIEQQKKEFENIKNKFFTRERMGHWELRSSENSCYETFVPGTKNIDVIKIIGCDTWGLYNACNVKKVLIRYIDDKMKFFEICEDRVPVRDIINGKEYKELPEQEACEYILKEAIDATSKAFL